MPNVNTVNGFPIEIAESQVTNLVADLASKQTAVLTNTHILVGNVSNQATDVALSGDATLANTGALTLNTVNSNVGSFGSATQVGTFTVNAKGLITAASNTTITGTAPGGTAGGDLTGTYPNPTIRATYPGQTSITTLGTITTGGWNAPGSVRLNGGNTTGFQNVANTNTAIIQATLTSNTSGHHAILQAEVAGVSTGSDPKTIYKNSNAGTDMVVGTDTSDSGAWKVSTGTDLGTNDNLKITTAGAVSIPRGDLSVTRSNSGATVGLSVVNSSNTASSNATISIGVAGGSAGDASMVYDNSGSNNFAHGIDNSDSDAWVLAASAVLGTTNVMRVSTAGEINYPLQPAFLGVLSGNATDVTGDGTSYQIGSTVAFTEIFDQGSDFNTNGTFTAPITGRYRFAAIVSFQGLLNTHTLVIVTLITSNRTYEIFLWGGSLPTTTAWEVSGGQLCDMDAGDTATLQLGVFNGTKVVDLNGVTGAQTKTSFSGQLEC